MTAERMLFARYPRVEELVPFVELADGLPTPVEQLDDGFWVKRDDLTDSHYGGNKVRKLEHVLAIALRRGGPVVTAGAVGSHHVYATAVHAARLGLAVQAVRFPQPRTPHVDAVDRALRALPNVTFTPVPHSYLMPIALGLRRAAERTGGYAVLPGATSPSGVLGYVNAGLELVGQVSDPPDDVVVALGSGGSAIGLAIGLALGGWHRTQVVAVRVADAVVTNRVVLAVHEAGARAALAFGGAVCGPIRLHIDRHWFGDGYGHPTQAGDDATRAAAELGLRVEPTYTAKALAAALDRRRQGRRVLFLQTFAG
jgi:D-cysteine desulfhydrase